MISPLEAPHLMAEQPSFQPVNFAVPSGAGAGGEVHPEQEIARLTWSVLDGSASLADRQRLAKLVNAQHALRHRSG